jgi:hypothetical protein
MSTDINPKLPFVQLHSADHPFSKVLEAYYGDLDAMRQNTELGLSTGTTEASIVHPQFNGESWAEKAANAARSLKPAARICASFYELNCYPPVVTNASGFEIQVLCSTLYVVPQCLDYEKEVFWIFCEGQQVIVSSVVDVQNGNSARITEMVLEYPNALGGMMDPRWHGMSDQRTNPSNTGGSGNERPTKMQIVGQPCDDPDTTADDCDGEIGG